MPAFDTLGMGPLGRNINGSLTLARGTSNVVYGSSSNALVTASNIGFKNSNVIGRMVNAAKTAADANACSASLFALLSNIVL